MLEVHNVSLPATTMCACVCLLPSCALVFRKAMCDHSVQGVQDGAVDTMGNELDICEHANLGGAHRSTTS